MLPRGFYGALSFWPTVFWPLIFSSAFYAFLRCCHLSRAQYGFSPLDGAPTPQLVAAWLFVSAAVVIELLAPRVRIRRTMVRPRRTARNGMPK